MCDLACIFQTFCRQKYIYISLVLVLKVKQPWKGNVTMKLEPQIAAFLVNNPKCCQNFVLTQQKTNFKSILPHIILSSEGQKLTCWVVGFFFLLSGLVVVFFFLQFTAQTTSTCGTYSPIQKGTLAFAAICAL